MESGTQTTGVEIMGTMSRIGKEGDLKISWNVDKEDEVEAARKLFHEKVTEKKWSAFEEKSGGKGTKITVFNKYAEKIVLVPPIKGG